MRPTLVLALVVLHAPASAETLLARAVIDIDHQHGCSQSVYNRGVDGWLTLEVGDDSTATLSLEIHEIAVSGPSLGRFKQGDTEFSDVRTKDRRTWTGSAAVADGGWIVRFDRVETAHVDQPQYGDLPYPRATSSPSSLVLECRRTPVPLYPAAVDEYSGWNTEGQQASPVDVVVCRPSEEIFDLAHLVTLEGALVLGFGAGVSASGWHMWGGSPDRLVLRKQAKTD